MKKRKRDIQILDGMFQLSRGDRHVMVKIGKLRIYFSYGGAIRRGAHTERKGKRRRFREQVYEAAGGVCQICGRPMPIEEATVHHIKRQSTHPELVWELTNCRCLCKECHEELHAAEMREMAIRGGALDMLRFG